MKTLFKNIIFIVISLAILIFLAFMFIRFYTGHDSPNVKTPNVEGLRIDKAINLLEEGGFDYEVTDTVYRDGKDLLSIIDQNPEPNFEVKKGRKIYLVINSDVIPEVEMPALAGRTSYAIALRILKNRGLVPAKKIERPHSSIKDPDSEPVLEQRIAGDTVQIEAGTKIKKHTRIDLVVGTMMKYSEEDDFFEGDDAKEGE